MTNSLEELFCQVDDFCQIFEPKRRQLLLGNGLQQRQSSRCLCMSEIMTILISFHQNHYRNFKRFYEDHVCKYWRKEFLKLPSYNRFVEFMCSAMMPLCIYLKQCFGECTGISFVDSTCLHVCHNRRIKQHRVFQEMAARGKTSVDWFFGFKLHLVVNKCGELLNQITPGNVDNRKPVPELFKSLFGKVFGDRGYVSQPLATQLLDNFGIEFFAKPKRNMKNRLMRLTDKLLSLKRSIIETVID